MKKQLLLLTVFFLTSYTAISQIITFDDQGHLDDTVYGNPYLITNNGETFIFTVSDVVALGPANHRYRTVDIFGCGNTGFNHMSSGSASATTWTIETQSGNEINLGTMSFDNLLQCFSFSYELVIEGFKNNVSTGSQTFTVSGMNSIFNSNASFDDVDKIVITCADLGNLGIDNINWTLSPLSSEDFVSSNTFNIIPNPSSDYIGVLGLKETSNFIIYDLIGKEIKKGTISSEPEILNTD
uniref:hypothetical protein n=1 Tax=Flavobacterium sp. TaxID=239 RepID=UPI00404B8BA9